MLKDKRGQNILEYVIVIVVVVTALLAINIYMKRGVTGKMRESTDQIGEQFDIANTETSITRKRDGESMQTVKDGVTTSETTRDTSKQSGTETVAPWTAPAAP